MNDEKKNTKRIIDPKKKENEIIIDKMTLGDELLENEFKRQKFAQDLLTKRKSDKET